MCLVQDSLASLARHVQGAEWHLPHRTRALYVPLRSALNARPPDEQRLTMDCLSPISLAFPRDRIPADQVVFRCPLFDSDFDLYIHSVLGIGIDVTNTGFLSSDDALV